MIGIGRWVRTNDNVELYGNRLTYYSKSRRTLAEWVDARDGFRNELDLASTSIAENIVSDGLPRRRSN